MNDSPPTASLPAGSVVGDRWEVGAIRPHSGTIMTYLARDRSGQLASDGLIEVYTLRAGQSPTVPRTAIGQAAGLIHPDLLSVFDVGVIESSLLYVVTEMWEDLPPDGPWPEDRLKDLAAAMTRALMAYHESGMHHGALHRAAIRQVGDRWKLGPGGTATVVEQLTAPYRPGARSHGTAVFRCRYLKPRCDPSRVGERGVTPTGRHN